MTQSGIMSSWCSWNVCGLSDLAKVRVVRSFIKSNWVGLCCMLENQGEDRLTWGDVLILWRWLKVYFELW